jgi:small-conductance mechanosensitive channel
MAESRKSGRQAQVNRPRMNSARCLTRVTGWILVACLLGAGFLQPAPGQISTLKKVVEGKEPEKPAEPEKADEIRKRLETWHQEARDALNRIDAGGNSVTVPEGISAAEFEERRRDLEQMVLVTTSAIKNLAALGEAAKAAETARAEEAAWTGFKEPPPYSVLMIDELLNERDAIKAKITSNESSLTNFERILATNLAEAKEAEEHASAMIAAVQNAAEGKADAAKWRLEAARGRARMLAIRDGYLQASCSILKDRIAASKANLALVERKVRTAAPQSRLREEDLDKIEKIASERKKSTEKEIAAVSKRLKTAMANRTQAQTALDALLATAVQGKEPEGLELAKFRVEVAEGRIESLQSMIENLESLVQLENVNIKSHQYRYAILTASDPAAREKALDSLSQTSDRLRSWLNVVENEISTSAADLSKIESRAASITTEDPRFALVNEQRAARSETLAMLQRAYQAVSAQRKLVRRWVNEYSPESDELGFFERVSGIASKTWDTIGKIWGFEVTSYENKVEVDGQTLTGKVPVSLGMLLRALLFFILGYWIASKIANRIQATLVTRGHIAETQARMLRNWLMIVVGLLLAIGTLSFLGIPITVFAFFGGALAIGIGFGMQTLIKNFISGIIVLAERKIRVGDVIDVDGIRGVVIEVNTRSSVVRSADDEETMIPNSIFLENRVTNLTLSSRKVRRTLRVGVAYGTPPQTVMEILTEAAGRHGRICKDPAPFAIFEDFGDNSLVFSLFFWVELGAATNAMVVTSDLRLMIDKRFNEAGIGIPFPQRDMHLTTDKPILVEISNPPAVKTDPYA